MFLEDARRKVDFEMSIRIINQSRFRRALTIIGFGAWMIPTAKTIQTGISPVIDFDTMFMTISLMIALYLMASKGDQR